MGTGFSALRKANRATACEEATSYGTSLFVQTGPGGLALRNALIMKKIVSFLDDRELSCWYESCHTFRNIIEKMDEICWKGRVQKLAIALQIFDLYEEAGVYQQLPFREIFYILLSKQIKSKLVGRKYYPHFSKVYQVTPPFLCEAARLAHQGILGPLTSLCLRSVDLATVPTDHLCSLVASVTDFIEFGDIDLSLVLDHVRCRELKLQIICEPLQPEDTRALVRAMKTRVTILRLEGHSVMATLNHGALTDYDGKGKCEQVIVSNTPMARPVMHYGKDSLKMWAMRINWYLTRYDWDSWASIHRKQDLRLRLRLDDSVFCSAHNCERVEEFCCSEF